MLACLCIKIKIKIKIKITYSLTLLMSEVIQIKFIFVEFVARRLSVLQITGSNTVIITCIE